MTSAKTFNLNADKKTLLVFGGSQGSEALNQCTAGMVHNLDDTQVLWQTGSGNFKKYDNYESNTVRVLPYIDDMQSAYALADLSFSRAGALTIAELAACGLPGVLVPLPSAAADHQTHNARSMAAAGAAEMIPEKELDPAKTAGRILSMLNDENTLFHMAHKSKNLGKPQAAKVIVDLILEKVIA
ncbi:MAG TPA: glycosyltransferase [Candidatus Marinimicrobia bacterium]|jgi:UDP-N-acetylglucosamine--N-acetylmuramyl-(pentapeptide) pyrophosphoryl-undecaprenol N-acetylglucosamine transferase|nr:hypothetical protein [Candidatus Neomarinimicrobiota bacterium]MDP7122024.1 glycosyltransferase [Candidatus Neomarinimicrobiota bacterium]MDP7217310.1 glycosyltransferase [Candidatus Neomarinimicrobiota bacterium]MDP7437536.1 glycosyltransferase [Candidatus Neomarinimicrobiota bacterium]HBN45888.1 hypothetical protein [Candidatus Neomarinimicrobiota bacterium]|tara:strand:- start:7465 stop:8019 length:555 start_codon:yes stop_codon:yes gene_type:complete